MKTTQRLSARQLRDAIHDEIGPRLFFIGARLTLLKDELHGRQKTRAIEILKELETARAQAQRLGRGLLDAGPVDLQAALRSLAKKMNWTFENKLSKPLHDPKQAAALFHIAREAAYNAARHGCASEILIRLSLGLLEVQDNGSGFPTKWRSGAGMKLMRQRARKIGGMVTVHRVATVGTILACQFPKAAR